MCTALRSGQGNKLTTGKLSFGGPLGANAAGRGTERCTRGASPRAPAERSDRLGYAEMGEGEVELGDLGEAPPRLLLELRAHRQRLL